MNYTSLLFLFLSAFLPLRLVSSRNGKNDDIYPIGNFQSSLTASEGHGTIAAIQSSSSDDGKNDDYVVIVSRSPTVESNYNLTRSFLTSQQIKNDETNKYNSEKEDSNDEFEYDEIPYEYLMTRGAVIKSP